MKYGVVSIVGKPNVGKSTLLNNLMDKDVVIATNKPQTTRNMIEISYKDKDAMINFIDTPGLHKAKNKLDEFLNFEIKKSLKKIDLSLYLFDISRDFDDEDEECLKILKDFKVKNVVLIINKIDLVDVCKIQKTKDFLKDKFNFLDILEISGKNKADIYKLIDFIKSKLSLYEGELEDLKVLEKEVSDKFFISELIREIIIKNFKQEIPYGVAIVIDEMKYDSEKNLLSIRYSIVVEKESQKPIIIGKNGSSIKNININLRKKLDEYYDCKIFTTSEVKVKKDWRNNNTQIKELGYKK